MTLEVDNGKHIDTTPGVDINWGFWIPVVIAVLLIIIAIMFRGKIAGMAAAAPTAAASVPAVPPPGSKPMPTGWLTDYHSLKGLSVDVGNRRVDVFEQLVTKAKQNPLDEYQLASDLMTGMNERLANSIPKDPGFGWDSSCECLIKLPAPVPVPAAK